MNFLNGKSGYLITTRAMAGQQLFVKNNDYERFLKLLKIYKEKQQIKIFGFCLLPDAFYLVLSAPGCEKIKIFLNDLCQTHTTHQCGEGKFFKKSWPKRQRLVKISNDYDLFETIKYVEFIPARLGLVDSPLHYPWSSCLYRVVGGSASFLDSDALVRTE